MTTPGLRARLLKPGSGRLRTAAISARKNAQNRLLPTLSEVLGVLQRSSQASRTQKRKSPGPTPSNNSQTGGRVACWNYFFEWRSQAQFPVSFLEDLKATPNVARRDGRTEEVIEAQPIGVDGALAGVYAIDENGIIFLSNSYLDLIFGYESGELTGQPHSILRDDVLSEQSEVDGAAIADSLARHGFWTGVSYNRRKNGSQFATIVRIWTVQGAGKTVRIFVHEPATTHSEATHLQILKRLDAAQEAERYRLARELHDQLGQDITALTLGIASLTNEVADNANALAKLDHLREIIKQLNQQVHDIASELRPIVLNDSGLEMALLNLIEAWAARTGLKVDFRVEGFKDRRLPVAVETAIYRVTQEALTNIFRHAQAQKVRVLLDVASEYVSLSVVDDGRGFDVDSVRSVALTGQKLGLLGMEERIALVSGIFVVVSAPEKGTRLEVKVPIS